LIRKRPIDLQAILSTAAGACETASGGAIIAIESKAEQARAQKIPFLGAAAVCSGSGPFLSRAGQDVTCIDVWRDRVDAISPARHSL